MPFLPSRSLPPSATATVVLIGALVVGSLEFRQLQFHRSLTSRAQGHMVTDARCDKSVRQGRATYSVVVAYTYTVNKTLHFGNSYFVSPFRVAPDFCTSISSSLKAGTAVTVFTDPTDPRFSVLDPTRQPALLFVAGPLAILSAAYLVHAFLRTRHTKSRSSPERVA